MLHKYRKTALIEAEQFDGSIEMARKYNIERGDTGAGYEYYLPTNKEIWLLTKATISLLAWMESIGQSIKIFLNERMRG